MAHSTQVVPPHTASHRLRLVVFHDGPRIWRARGLEHDFVVEARTFGDAVRMALQLVETRTAFEVGQGHVPLTGRPPAPNRAWNAYMTGIPVSLAELGLGCPEDWEVCVAVAYR